MRNGVTSEINVAYDQIAEDDDEFSSDDEGLVARADEFSARKIRGVHWLRRGMVARRLRRPHEAEKAFRMCLKAGFSLQAWVALVQM